MVGTGNDIAEAIGNSARTPEWVIVDGGELHRTSVEVMKARHLKKWGIRGSLSVWGIHVEKDHIPCKHTTVEKMMERLLAAVQTRLRKAYNAVGGTRFKPDTTGSDFSFAAGGRALAANPMDEWGEELHSSEWALQRKWDWPDEPDEGKLADDDARIRGVETTEGVSDAEWQERKG